MYCKIFEGLFENTKVRNSLKKMAGNIGGRSEDYIEPMGGVAIFLWSVEKPWSVQVQGP
jgi:hypothetical protein